MSALDKIADKLPDVYFDWYARLLPGVAAVIALMIKAPSCQREFVEKHIWAALVAAYLLGHFIQPLSSFVVKRNEYWWGGEELLEQHKRAGESKNGLEKKASKAHAEAVSMLSSSVLIFVVAVYYHSEESFWDCWYVGMAVFLAVSSAERIFSRMRKIKIL